MTAAPRVTIHYAQSLDGRIATRTGHSRWISCGETLDFAHQLRAEHEAVMVGVGTVLMDDPRLTVRLVPGRSPLRVVVDSTLRLPLDAQVLTDGAARTLVATTERAPADRILAVRNTGAQVEVVEQTESGRVDLVDLLRRLSASGLSSVLVEGGAELITSLLLNRLADRLVICVAPRIIGAGVEAVGDLDVQTMAEALCFAQSTFACVGEDVIFDGRLVWE